MDNKEVVEAMLKEAIYQRNSEISIQNYIKFMDSLDKTERKTILLDKTITKLIDKINGDV